MKLIIASDSGSTINLDRVSLVEETLHRDRSPAKDRDTTAK